MPQTFQQGVRVALNRVPASIYSLSTLGMMIGVVLCISYHRVFLLKEIILRELRGGYLWFKSSDAIEERKGYYGI